MAYPGEDRGPLMPSYSSASRLSASVMSYAISLWRWSVREAPDKRAVFFLSARHSVIALLQILCGVVYMGRAMPRQ